MGSSQRQFLATETARIGESRRVAVLETIGLQFPRGFENRVSDRADVRVNALEIAQHVKMQGACLDALWSACAQTRQMTVGRREFHGAQLRLFRNQSACDSDVAGHEHPERELEAVQNTLVKG